MGEKEFLVFRDFYFTVGGGELGTGGWRGLFRIDGRMDGF